jgi:hypothetical protein
LDRTVIFWVCYREGTSDLRTFLHNQGPPNSPVFVQLGTSHGGHLRRVAPNGQEENQGGLAFDGLANQRLDEKSPPADRECRKTLSQSASEQPENVVAGNRRFQQPLRRDFADVSDLISNRRDLANCALKTLLSFRFLAQP